MKVTYVLRGVPGRLYTDAERAARQVVVTCRSAHIRDGVLTMVGGHGDETVEHGIPVDLLDEFRIYRRPLPDLPPATGFIPLTALRAAHRLGEHVGYRQAGCPECPQEGATEDHPPASGDPFDEMRLTLEGWIEGVRSNHSNHYDNGHDTEARPCWDTFDVEDIRRMIEDARKSWIRGREAWATGGLEPH